MEVNLDESKVKSAMNKVTQPTLDRIGQMLAKNHEKNKANQPPSPTVDKVENPEGQTAAPEPTEGQSKVEPQAAQTEPKIEESKEPEIQNSWDDQIDTKQETTPIPQFDFKRLGSALELGETKDEDEFRAKVSELKSSKKQLEESQFAGLPDEFKEVAKVAKTGDWKAFLAEQLIDYGKHDPLKLYEDSFFQEASNLPEFKNQDGTLNEQAVWDAIDAIPKAARAIEGHRIKNSLIAGQASRRQEIINRTQAKINHADEQLAKATNNLNDILPFESYGIKFESKHSNQIHKGISNSSLTKKHLGQSYEDLIRNGVDMKQIVRTITLAEHGEQFLKFKSGNAKAVAARELLQKTQNAVITTTGSPPTPEESPDKKPLSAAQKMAYHLEQQKKGGLLGAKRNG